MTERNEAAERESNSHRKGTSGSSSGRKSGPPCPFCEAGMYKRHCKYVCPQHGVVYDCSDPFR